MVCVFVILHYLTLTDTLEAIASIKNYEPGSHIVIVDNASRNGSLEKLEIEFQDDCCVDIIASPDNIGFARGNNLGIEFARSHFAPDFICVMNNDVLLIESILQAIADEYLKSEFSVLGPMIYTADGRCDDNPGPCSPMTYIDLEKTINDLNRTILINRMHIGKLYSAMQGIRNSYRGKCCDIRHKEYLSRLENVQLHGSFLVFSRRFFEQYEGFYDGTFLNMEEDILFWQLQKKNLTTVYLPYIHIFHKEDSASKQVWPKERTRAIAKTQNWLNSAQAFKKLMLEE